MKNCPITIRDRYETSAVPEDPAFLLVRSDIIMGALCSD
ncbi:hypothetical protein ASAP_0272 [Asaia bogorensis]|uniref:Uncharacterized protein n=1 Tax=Asaia bogorensis TaxID=91915 RepID=A0A060QHQ3_9PROT|nr:hypothetical protein ASAP_0272 [Asaia bogorensis]